MPIDLPAEMLLTVMLAAMRAGAWLAIAPPFSSKSIPRTIKAMLPVVIALPAVASGDLKVPPADTASVISAMVLQLVTGAALGFMCLLIFSAVQAAGDLLDVFGGFSLSFAFDPMSQQGNAVFGKFFQLLSTTLLLASGGYLIVLKGFYRSYQAIPLDAGINLRTLTGVL